MSASCCCGDLCIPCANLIFSDDFTGALGGYTTGTCPGAGTGNAFTIGGGLCTDTFGGVPYTNANGFKSQSITIPALATLCMSICVKYRVLAGQAAGSGPGIFFGNFCGGSGGPMNAKLSANSGQSYTMSQLQSGHSFTTGAGALIPADGDTMTMIFTRVVATGNYNLKGYINGILVAGFNFSVLAGSLPGAFAAGNPIQAGIFDSGGGAWSALRIYTS